MRISEAFERVNDFGVFQKFVMIILAFGGAFHGMQSSSTNFISGKAERWCEIKELQNFSYDQQKNIAIPYDTDGMFDSCSMYDLPWENYTIDELVNWNRSEIGDDVEITPCNGYVYSKEIFTETAISKWDLTCSETWQGELLSTLYVTGLFLGSVTSGRLSDSLGRRIAQFVFCVILTCSLFAAAFVHNAIAFLILRLIIGFSMRGTNISASVLMMELSGPKQREFAGILVPGFFAIGVMICSGCAVALRNFQNLHIVMGGIASAILLTQIVLPESPRWLVVTGKVDEAEKTMRWIGEVNNRPLRSDFTLKQEEVQKEKTQASYLDLFKYPVLRKHLLIMHFLWIAANFSHMAMTINLGALTGNAYLNVFLSGATELPASISVMFAMRMLGRKKTFIYVGVLFTLCNAVAVPFEIYQDLRIAASIATIFARASASALLCDLRVLTSELFPTSMRQRVLGGCTGLAAAFGISGSYIGGSLRDIWRPLPNIIFGSLGFVGVIFSTFLPETIGKGLPESIDDAIAMAKKHRTWTSENLPTVSNAVDIHKNPEVKEKPGEMTRSNGSVMSLDINGNSDNSLNNDILVFHL